MDQSNLFDVMSPVGLSTVACLLGFQIPANKAKMPAGFCNTMRDIPWDINKDITIGKAIELYLAWMSGYYKQFTAV